MKLSIIGTGYVGLVTGVCMAEMGNSVVCVDSDQTKVDNLKQLKISIYEPGLDTMLKSNYEDGRISFTSDIKQAVEGSDLCFIAVGTPQSEDGSADIQNVIDVARSIGKYMTHRMYIVVKSTVPVGTSDRIKEIVNNELQVRGCEFPFDVISNPEFLKEGAAIGDCMRPDRVIIGANNDKAEKIMKELYLPFIRNTENFISMDIRSAEMTKYTANAMLATKISFMNEIANVCDSVGADVNKVRIGIGSDQRIGYQFIYAGCGYGGSCFPKDVRALIHTSETNGYVPIILKSVEEVNFKQKQYLVKKIIKRFNNLEGLTFAVWGLSFKPDTDDMREASSITIIKELIKGGARIHAYDPKAMNEAKNKYLGNENIEYFSSKYNALPGCQALLLITEWKEFRSPDFYEIERLLKQPIIFDGRNQYDAQSLKELGFEYYQVGAGAAE